MALTRDFKETIRARIECDPDFRKALLEEGVECFLSGDVETGKVGPARLHQCDHRIPGAGRVDRQAIQEPDAHAWPQGQSPGPQSVRHYRLPPGTRGNSPQGPGRSLELNNQLPFSRHRGQGRTPYCRDRHAGSASPPGGDRVGPGYCLRSAGMGVMLARGRDRRRIGGDIHGVPDFDEKLQ